MRLAHFGRCVVFIACGAWLAFSILVEAQDKVAAPSEPPKILVCTPLAVPVGATTKLTVRGWRLADIASVRIDAEKIVAKILSKGTAPTLDKYDAKRIGDQQLELELTVPKEMTHQVVKLVVESSAGESSPHALLVGSEFPLLPEQEPNDGFRQSQLVTIPQAIDGTIHANQNVDVFRFQGRAGQRLVAEVLAARYGSALDAILLLHDAQGNLVATSDDVADQLDARLEVLLPNTATYFLTLQDAHDRGTTIHSYRLQLTEKK